MRRVITLLCLMLGIGCKMLAMNGTGTAEDPYQISTADELYEFASIVNGSHASIEANVAACAVIMNDIVINESVLDSVGNLRSGGSFRSWTIIDRFEGVLDGKNHVIRGLYVSGSDKAGFIMHMVGAEVRNLGFEDSYLTSTQGRCGGICGHSRASSMIRNCYYIGSLNCGGKEVGGICSLCNASSVINCFSIYKISSAGKIDGICSVREDAEIDNCYSMPFTEAAGSELRVSFEDGEVAYKLQNGQTEHVWGQKIGVDKHPIFGGDTVYALNVDTVSASAPCLKRYVNDLDLDAWQHVFGHCVCVYCGYRDTACVCEHEVKDCKCIYCGEEIHAFDNCYCVHCRTRDITCTNHEHRFDYCLCVCGERDSLNSCWFEIRTVDDLYTFAEKVNAGNLWLNARLMNDITINENVLDSVGNLRSDGSFKEWTIINRYEGVFDGMNHVIRGLYVSGADKAGFIMHLISAEVRNLGFEDSYLTSTQGRCGGICGHSRASSMIRNCYYIGSLNCGGKEVGGICSLCNASSVINCFSIYNIIAAGKIDGICSVREDAEIDNCYSMPFTEAAGSELRVSFENGEVAYKLQNGQTEHVWGQKVGIDKHPIFGGDTVYASSPCPKSYGNASNIEVWQHDYGHCVCTYCGYRDTTCVCEHVVKNCKCVYCGEAVHAYDNCVCTSCGYRDTACVCEHEVKDCKCIYCGEEIHAFDNCYCVHCQVRDTACTNHVHRFESCLCVCGEHDTSDSCWFEIRTVDDLYTFAERVNAGEFGLYARLMNDITINENVLDSVGNLRSGGSFREWTIIDRFEGVLDGKNHVIRGLYVRGGDKAGFIMHMVGAEVRNLGFEDSYLTSESGRCGGICGHSRASSTIRNCYYIGSLNCGGREVGGICSLCNASSVINCFSIYKISSAGKIDGICSVREDAEIDNCYSMPFTEAVGSKKRVSFENGEVAYKLQDGQTEHVWGQKIGVDKHPVFGGDTVYASFPCSKYFANDLISDTLQHVFDHCVCKECGFIDTTCFINDWFEIYTVDDLYEFARIVNDGHPMLNARLMNDIVLNEDQQFTVTWEEASDWKRDCLAPWPGGDSLTWIVNGFIGSYSGIFDGQNHVIRGLCGALEGGGFIEYMDGGELRNVGIEDIFLYSCGLAAFVKSATNTKFSNCYVSGNVLSSQDAASLASYSHSCSFEGCYNMAKIVGYDWGSGITCAKDDNVSVNRCWNAGDVIALNVASGLVTFYSSTWEQDTCFISNSYNLGEIETTGKGGGVGIATYLSNNGVMSDAIYVDNCYNAGIVAGTFVDPIAYDCNDGRLIYLSNCYYLDSCVAKGSFFEPYPGSVDVHAMSAEQFANGEVCYRLNKGVTDGTQPFYQNLNEVRVRPVPMRPAPVTVDPYPVLDNTHLTVYTDGDTYFNYKTNVGVEQTSDDLSNPLVYVVDRTIYVCNVEGRVLLSDMNGRILFSQKVQKEGTSSCAEIPVRDAGVYLLVVNGAPCKVVAR